MNKLILTGVTALAFRLLALQSVQAQGTTYLSNVGQASTGSFAIGSDAWRAASFKTGTNAAGYLLNSIQLGMTGASGSPGNFSLQLYSALTPGEYYPGSGLASLTGPLNPATNGIYTFIPASNLTLSSRTVYFIVLTAGTAIGNGAYDWSFAGAGFNRSGGWSAPAGFAGADNYQSNDGLAWNFTLDPFGQFAVNATAVPEPSCGILLGLGGFLGIWIRRKAKAAL